MESNLVRSQDRYAPDEEADPSYFFFVGTSAGLKGTDHYRIQAS